MRRNIGQVVLLIVAAVFGGKFAYGQTTPPPCPCKFQNALSKAPRGTCSLVEDMSKSCELIWGDAPGSSSAVLPSKRVDQRAVIQELKAAAASSDNSASTTSKLRVMREDSYWQSLVSLLADVSRDKEADIFERSLALLADRNLVMKTPDLTAAAASVVVAVGLQRIAEAGTREAILRALLSRRDFLLNFSPSVGKSSLPIEPVKIPASERKEGVLVGVIAPGCLDISIQEYRYAQLILAPWSEKRSNRCN